MSTTRDHGNIVFECDDCGETLETDTPNFEEAIEIMKEKGWVYAKVNGEHTHNCPDCKMSI